MSRDATTGRMDERPLVLVSNRGPVSFTEGDGVLTPMRGAGGLVSGLGPVMATTGCTWIAAAMSDGDRAAAAKGSIDVDGITVHLLDLPADRFELAYDTVGNATLWFLHHHLFDLVHRPRFDDAFAEAWAAFREVNHAFSAAVVETAPAGAVVLLQDYHLSLVAPRVRDERPDLTLVHFAHTPFASPDMCRVLPEPYRRELLQGLEANHACGFHTHRWAATFSQAVIEELGAAAPTFVSPLAPDADALEQAAREPAAIDARRALDALVDGRHLIARVDRIELSKNLVRGFLAYDLLLDRHAQWREAVVFGAYVYPSRQHVPEYVAYREEVEALVESINARWATATWTPIHLDTSDDYPASIAALQSYDVLLVNPIRDGLNLVAKEGPILNERDGTLLLSPEAGAWAELGGAALAVHPYDISGTADQLHAALSLDRGARATRAAHLRALATARAPSHWLTDQRAAAASSRPAV